MKHGIKSRSAEWNWVRGLGRGLGEPLLEKIFECATVQLEAFGSLILHFFQRSK